MPASNYQKTLNIVKRLLKNGGFDEDESALKLVETHISLIVLGSEYAWKFKKPVNFGFLDFSTLEKRRHCCLEELRLNSRFAKEIYLEVVSIREHDGEFSLFDDGNIVEYAVKMNRFDDSKLLGELQSLKLITLPMADDLANAVAHFHQKADRRPSNHDYATPTNISHWFEENFDHIKPLLESSTYIEQIQNVQHWGQQQIKQHCALMQNRRDNGFVRECHGDLHLGNIVLLNGAVILFDCIEFNPYLRWSDTVCDTAFLVMDLLHRKEHALAFRFLNRYLEITGDYNGLAVLPYYLAYRALVRAKVAILRIEHCDADDKNTALREYQEYVNLASLFSEKKSPCIVITHGLSGSGKSSYAKSLADYYGAIRIRSDIERKRLANIAELNSSHSDAGGGLYDASNSEQTYEHLLWLARRIVETGFSVIVDATFLKAEQRKRFCDLAKSENMLSIIMELTAPDSVLESRISKRMNKGDDPSEATLSVLALQQTIIEALQPSEADVVIQIDTTLISASSDEYLAMFSPHISDYCKIT